MNCADNLPVWRTGITTKHPSLATLADPGSAMRLARVLHPHSPAPLVALERDGCIYDAAELDRHFATPVSQRVPFDSSDFHLRVFALRAVGLDKLDDHLRGGDRPTEARLSKSNILWMPPCSPDRAIYVQVDTLPAPDAGTDLPQYHLGNPRTLFGHQETIPFPHDTEQPDADVAIAALISEELRSCTVAEAEDAIIGYSILVRWKVSNAAKQGTCAQDPCFATSLGPVLVTKDEAGDIARAGLRIRMASDIRDICPQQTTDWSLAEAIAFISRYVPLAPGDVVAGPPIVEARQAINELRLSFGTPLEVSVERLGKLTARAVRGPEPPSCRKGR